MYLLFEEIEGDTNLKGKAPELVETLTEVDDTICVSTHKVHHLCTEQEQTRRTINHVCISTINCV